MGEAVARIAELEALLAEAQGIVKAADHLATYLKRWFHDDDVTVADVAQELAFYEAAREGSDGRL